MKDARCDMGNDKKRMQALKLGQALEFANLSIHASFGICDPVLHKFIFLNFFGDVKINEVVHEA